MRRLTILIGRVGTVLIAIGLGLLLISLIPTRAETPTSRSDILSPKSFTIAYSANLNPQRGIRVTIETNGELKAYIIQANYTYFINWLHNNFPEPFNYSQPWKTAILDSFFSNHSDIISYESTGQVEFDYIPTKIEEATVVFANYGNTSITYEYQISVINLIAPSGKMFMTAEIIIPIGLVLSAPWLISFWKEKQKKR
jgi:hypothetical protein